MAARSAERDATVLSMGRPRSRLAIVTALLAAVLGCGQGAGPRFAPTEESEALVTAGGAGDIARIGQLLGRGVPVDARGDDGRTALLSAVAGNRVGAARLLLERGASVNAQADDRDTPWLLAGAEGRHDIVALMLTREPDLFVRNRFGGNALIPACERGHVETVRLLLRTAIDLDHVNNLGWTCLLELVVLGDGGPRHQEIARLVLEAGADPNIPDRDGLTPLAHARRSGQRAVAQILRRAGAATSGGATQSGTRR